jgi:hypothetical protein
LPISLRSTLVLLLAACASRPAAPGGAGDPVDRSIPSASPALDALALGRGDLPAGVTVASADPFCNSVQPLTFYSRPTLFGMAPRPLARRAQVLRRGDRVVGSVLMFEYGPDQIRRVRSILDPHLWGEAGGPSDEHPEEVAVVGGSLLILCFDPGDPAGAWYAERLRTRNHARVARPCPELAVFDRQAADAHATTAEAAAPIAARHEQALLACSLGALRVAELARELGDWPRAEAGFRRALALDAAGDALTYPGALFAAQYGLALAVATRGRPAESIPLYERAVATARDDGDTRAHGWAEFNLACALAEAGRFDDAASALQRAIALDPSHRERARRDRSFERARALPDFRRILR